jgi:Tat protein translocase TatC
MGAGYSFYFKNDIFDWLLAPAGTQLSPNVEGFDGKPTYGSPIGMMAATITVVTKGAMLTALPVIMYSVLSLIRPWLPPSFWRFLVYITVAVAFSYLTGIAFVYYVMLPVGLGFLLNFGADIAVPLIDIGEYLGLLTALMSAMGFVFLIPTFMFLLTKLRIVKYRHWRWGRMVVPLFAGFLGIILTPTTDGVNFLMVGLPVMGLYEIGLFVTWLLDPSDGNYLWFKTIGRILGAIRDAVVWVLRRPVVAWRKVERKLVEWGLAPWW